MRSKKAIIQNWCDLYKQLSIDFTQCFTKNIVSSPDRMVNVSSFVYNIEKKLFKCKWRFLFGAFVSSSCVFLVSRLIHKKFWSRNVDWRLTLSFRLNLGGQVVGQGWCNMAKPTIKRHCFKYFKHVFFKWHTKLLGRAWKATGTVMRGRQYHSGQDQGGCCWILENNFLQVLFHIGKKTLPNSNANM